MSKITLVSNKEFVHNCEYNLCGKAFLSTNTNRMYCSRSCAVHAHRDPFNKRPRNLSDFEGEQWTPINNYEGLYLVSNMGRVKGLHQNNILVPGKDRSGYCIITLCKENIKKTRLVARLVAKHFVHNPDNKPQVNHEDGDKTNNKSSNLTWVTQSENTIHAIKTGLQARKFIRTLNEESAVEIMNLKGKLSQGKISKMFGISISNISALHNRKIWKNATAALCLILLLFSSCSNQEQENVTPNPPAQQAPKVKSSARLNAECEDLTASNGLTIENCEIGLGGTLLKNTVINVAGYDLSINNFQNLALENGTTGLIVSQYAASIFSDAVDDHSTITTQNDGTNTYVLIGSDGLSYSNNINLDKDGIHIKSNGVEIITIKGGKITLSVPSSSAGLSSNQIYKDSNGFLKITP